MLFVLLPLSNMSSIYKSASLLDVAFDILPSLGPASIKLSKPSFLIIYSRIY